MKPAILLSAFVLLSIISLSQAPSISDDSVLLKIKVSGHDGAKIEGPLQIYNNRTHQLINSKINKEGRSECRLSTGESYTIRLKESEDTYNYDIPEFSISPQEIELKFHTGADTIYTAPETTIIETPVNVPVGIRLLNKGEIKKITVNSGENFKKEFTLSDDTTTLLLDPGKNYKIAAGNLRINNNNITTEHVGSIAPYYILYARDEKNADLILMDKTEAMIHVVYTDLHNIPVKNDTVIISTKGSGKKYRIVTSENGTGAVAVPRGGHYSLSLKYFENVFEIDIPPFKNDYAIIVNNVKLEYPSPSEYIALKKEEMTRIARRDSIYMAHEKINEKPYLQIETELKTAIPAVLKGLEQVDRYFEKTGNTVCAALYRNRGKWKSKMIVTDVTGSMYPYMREVCLWHLLELIEKKKSSYTFFNDGDNMPDYYKKTGNTGGIYFSLSNAADSMIKTMYYAMSKGDGGDIPENDIEALLKAAEHMPSRTELILVADNLSPVKDIRLLEQLNVPVRVILCGTAGTWVTTDYLEIAYNTGGSIHTIEEDIDNLSLKHDGESLIINRCVYKLSGGRFFLVERKL
ncbi:MAG: hypothetical protein QM791_21105 [Ferruginibacter sp.]